MARRNGTIPPYRAQLATLVEVPPEGPGWVHEVKYDGYRIGCAVERGRATLWSRNGKDWTAAFPEVARAAQQLPVSATLLDGEVAMVLPGGRTSFQALQQRGGGRAALAYFVFDLLHLDGEDLAGLPLTERKARLERLLARRGGDVLRYAPHAGGSGAAALRAACSAGLEGIVSKRADGRHQPGRGATWTKAKCVARQELVIGGFTEPAGSREGIGALLVGLHQDGALRFAGKVGTGFTREVARDLRARLEPLRRPAPPFAPAPRGGLARAARWVEPVLVAEVQFTEWTADGKVRHPSFLGLRTDKPAGEVVREGRPAATAPPPTPARPRRGQRSRAEQPAVVAGVRISSPDRVIFPEPGITKRDLARYYEAVSGAMVPHLAGRPLTLVQCPTGLAGGCRYLRHARAWAPAPVRRVRIREKRKMGEYLVVDGAAALVTLAQLDVVELHTWNATADRLELPDRLVIDLDPGPEVPFSEVMAAARLVRGALGALGLAAFVKTTGGSGLHLVVPLLPVLGWDACLSFARGLCATVARHAPRVFTVAFARRGRERKILLDYLRNSRASTSVAAFSARVRADATVSVPLAWDELTRALRPDRFTVRSVPRRLAALRADPWAGYRAAARALDVARLAAVGAHPLAAETGA
ncbi:MAG: DNA ligase D [Anaeromyxobacter sp.]